MCLRPRRRRSERGQASIMIALMMLTFLFFFGFVINTGMLVNAKINLQNAADMAAYAGASVQARQLTQISYLNYEMRRQYKKFLYRYYVLGNMFQEKFPRDTGQSIGQGGRTKMHWSPDGSSTFDYNVPIVCIAFNANDNFCKVPKLARIVIPQATAFDAINDALIEALKKIEQVRTNNCAKIGYTNSQLLYQWLWNADPDYRLINDTKYSEEVKESLAVIRGVSFGLGLIPKEILLWRRIKTLEEYVNSPALGDMNLDKVNELRDTGNSEPLEAERTIQAFLSAYYTLGNWTFDAGTVRMDELLPERILRLEDLKITFDAYAAGLERAAGDSQDCTFQVVRDGVDSPLPVAVMKDPSVLTYYALRLKGKAKLMFSPFGDLELKAYAAARPFGSRIGPRVTENDFIRTGASPNLPKKEGNFLNKVPNLKITEEDKTSTGGGWDTREVLGALYQAFNPPGTAPGTIPPNVDSMAVSRAYHVAMAPNPWEGKRYNIPFDGNDPFVRQFDGNRVLSFFAPVFPEKKKASLQGEVESLVTSLVGTAGEVQQRNRELLKMTLNAYVTRLLTGQGEEPDFRPSTNDGQGAPEGFKIVRIADPVNTRPQFGDVRPINFPGLVMNDPKDFKTSWNDVNSEDYTKKGRIGYSVKFVSFDSLQKGEVTNGQDSSNNPPVIDTDAEGDLPYLKH